MKDLIEIQDIDSKALAANIVVYRLLGINKELSIKSMEELLRRKIELSDSFDYETYINKELKDSPNIEEESRNILTSISNIKFK